MTSPIRIRFEHAYRSDPDLARVVDDLGLVPALLSAADLIATHLPALGVEVPVVIDPAVTEILIPSQGWGGWSDPARDGLVVLTFDAERLLDPDRGPELARRMVGDLCATLAHEAHHAVRHLAGPRWGDTLGEAIVSEGLAVAFEVEIYPDTHWPWADAYPVSRDSELWYRARALWDSPADEQVPIWMFGGDVVPNGTGYTLGYRLVRAFVRRNPGTTAGSLVGVRAEDIVRGSGFPRQPGSDLEGSTGSG